MKLWIISKFDKTIRYGLNSKYNKGYKDAVTELEKKYNEKLNELKYNHQTEIIELKSETDRLKTIIQKNNYIIKDARNAKFKLKRKNIQYDYIINEIKEKLQNLLEQKSREISNIFFDIDNLKQLMSKNKKLLEE